jgi:hypothetical protein
MRYIIAGLLSFMFFLKVEAKEMRETGSHPDKCVRSQKQNERPLEYRLRSFQNNRRNYKWYDNARESYTVSKDYMYNGWFRADEY